MSDVSDNTNTQQRSSINTQPESFFGLGIAPGLIDIIDRLNFKTPTPIQFKGIPIAIAGQDLIGIAQTGTGKTLAFGIPMIQRLAQNRGRGVVLVPTRELAIQVNEALMQFTPAFKMKTAVIIGGEAMSNQIHQLNRNPQIIIATPGRLNDLINQRLVNLSDTSILVLDEADRMLDMGFLPQIERIMKHIPKKRQTMLFSATMPDMIVRIAAQHMSLPVQTSIAPSGTTAELVSQEIFVVSKFTKERTLLSILDKYPGSVLMFVRTRIGATKVTRTLRNAGYSASEIHSDRTLAQRKDALRGFKTGEYRILVATDIAARGIDVTGIELVINHDLPDDAENYVHRIGRTGRAGMKGHAITLATPDQRGEINNIEKIIRSTIPLANYPDIPTEKFFPAAKSTVRSFFPRGGRGGGGRSRFRR